MCRRTGPAILRPQGTACGEIAVGECGVPAGVLTAGSMPQRPHRGAASAAPLRPAAHRGTTSGSCRPAVARPQCPRCNPPRVRHRRTRVPPQPRGRHRHETDAVRDPPRVAAGGSRRRSSSQVATQGEDVPLPGDHALRTSRQRKNATSRCAYPAPATARLPLCFAPGTSQTSFGSPPPRTGARCAPGGPPCRPVRG